MITAKEQYNFLDYFVFSKSLEEMMNGEHLMVNTINQYSYCLAHADDVFKKSLQESDLLVPDGVGVVYAMKFLTGNKVNKIAGADLHEHILKELNLKSGRCFYLGSSDSTLKKITEKLALQYPNIKVGTFSPPFKSEFSEAESEEMVARVNDFNPDVLFVGMTAPKQEKWTYIHKPKLKVKVICTIGAVFDFYAGNIKRPNQIWVKLGLEWFGRLVNEPKRLWIRYLYFGPMFIWLIFKEKTKLMLQVNLKIIVLKEKLTTVKIYLEFIRCFPHLLLLLLHKNKHTIKADLARWMEIYDIDREEKKAFLYLLSFFPEFRNVFYHRVGAWKYFLNVICPKMPTLYILTDKIGKGFFIQHGFATVIAATSIGENCWVNQQVTIGYSAEKTAPYIRDNVTINAGAKVIGGIRVGNNSIVGANAVVVRNVPDNCTVGGVPAQIIKRDGCKVSELNIVTKQMLV